MTVDHEFTTLQKKVVAAVPIITGSLSILGSSLIIFMILSTGRIVQKRGHDDGNRDHKSDSSNENDENRSDEIHSQESLESLSELESKRESTKRSDPSDSGGSRSNNKKIVYHRLMFGMSVMDIIHSATQVCSSFPMPLGTKHVYGAIGNDATCTVQGFFGIVGGSVPMYNCALSLYYVLTIKYDVKESVMSKTFEPLSHVIIILYPLSLAIVALAYDVYGSESAYNCQVAPKMNTTSSHDQKRSNDDSESNMIRKNILNVLIISGICLIVIVVGCMALVVHSVFQQSKAILKQNKTTQSNSIYFHRARLLAVTKQALLYASFFFLTLFFTVVEEISLMILDRPTFAYTLLSKIFYPLQGFFNYFVFIKPRAIQIQRKGNKSFLSSMYQATVDYDGGIRIQKNLERRHKHSKDNDYSCDSCAIIRNTPSNYPLPTITETEKSVGSYEVAKGNNGLKNNFSNSDYRVNTLSSNTVSNKIVTESIDEIFDQDHIHNNVEKNTNID
jgi:hypothetical protein